ncbi:MAG: hypothetical protein N2444_04640, partial [Methylocystis sp.]|nr:hypothetical protein [Methylocystis sp.]
ALIILADADEKPSETFIGSVLCLILGSVITALALWRGSNPGRPFITISPAGIRYRIWGAREFAIPWREIKGVDTIDIVTNMPWYFRLIAPRSLYGQVFHGVTVVSVSKQFYDERIFVDSLFLRGPGWDNNFLPKGHLVQVALHHDLVSVEPRQLREAVEARWRAFRDGPGVTSTEVVAMGDDRRTFSRWEAALIAFLLIGVAAALANIAGLWQLSGQVEARLARMKAREENEYWNNAAKRHREESEAREARQKEMRRDFDETMKRAFGQ